MVGWIKVNRKTVLTDMDISTRYKRICERFLRERAGRIVPLTFVGDYADLFMNEPRLIRPRNDASTTYALDLRTFTDELLNRATSQYHDRWISLTMMMTDDAGAQVPDTSQLEYLLRYFEQELELPPSMAAVVSSNEAAVEICKRLDRMNGLMARRLMPNQST